MSGELLRSVPLTERREWYGALASRPASSRPEFAGSKLFYVRGVGSGVDARADGRRRRHRRGQARRQLPAAEHRRDRRHPDPDRRASAPSSPLGSGGVINIATASGTNRSRARRRCSCSRAAGTTRNQPGGTSTAVDQTQIDLSLGGPVVKNRVWGFGSYPPRRRHHRREPHRGAAGDPAGAGPRLRAGRHHERGAASGSAKLTAQAGGHQLAGFYQTRRQPGPQRRRHRASTRPARRPADPPRRCACPRCGRTV